MCYKVDCRTCGKATWAGCGMHVSCALSGIEEKDRCPNWKKGASGGCINGDSNANKNTDSSTDGCRIS